MKEFGAGSDDNGLMVKIVGGLTVLVVLAGVGLTFFASRGNSEKAEGLYAKAYDACHQDQLGTCLGYVNQALALQEKPSYLELKFNTLYSQGKNYEAKLVLEKLMKHQPNDAQNHKLMASILWAEGESERAFTNLEKAIELDPMNGDYRIAKATWLVDSGRQAEAVPIYKQLLSEDPRYYHYWNQYALSYSNNKQYDEALKIRKEGVRQEQNDYMQHFGIASLYDAMGKKDLAVAAYRRSLELHPLTNSIAAKRIFEITGKRVPSHLENLTSGSIPFEKRGNVMFVTADVNGQRGRFLVDTGASMSVIFKGKTEKYQLKPIHQVLSFETANGFVRAPIAYGSIRLGKYDLDTIRFAVISDHSDKNLDGIIGMNVLNEFQFEINQGSQTILLKR